MYSKGEINDNTVANFETKKFQLLNVLEILSLASSKVFFLQIEQKVYKLIENYMEKFVRPRLLKLCIAKV